MITCVIADNQRLFRQALSKSVESCNRKIKFFEEYGDAREAANRAVFLKTDLLILDGNIPGSDPFEAARWARRVNKVLKVVFFSNQIESHQLSRAIDVGAHGFLTKSISFCEVCTTIEKVYQGDKCFPANTLTVSSYKNQSKNRLTSREFQVLKLLAEANTVKEVAIMLKLSAKTVGVHKCNLMKKLDIHNKAQLVAYAINNGIMSMERVAG